MNGLDLLSLTTSVMAICAAAMSLCRWLSLARRLRAVDEMIHRVEVLMAAIGEEDMFTYQSMDILWEVDERLLKCVYEKSSYSSGTGLNSKNTGRDVSSHTSENESTTQAPSSAYFTRPCLDCLSS
jgi:hypothetical protein